ncbi:glycosyltransferase [Frateuria hangzhouensis]|uniref:glycosyltransferase n=1 Tax=Frateuria hangzhouensis TaxID=2995589 RepID=UPI0022608502|nr:glycosyltransferase [Frateuria sp. STR12]MCX7513740.1 glycosyltransferase [Frateuria sp. STR12]
MSDTSTPLVTLVVLIYNQAQYVREAISAAFAQIYPNLEILISDDASTDGSSSIAAQAVASYTGSHAVRLNINSQNLGIGEHVNKVFELAQGEMIVLAAGDDISLPQRASRIMERWMASHERPDAIYCGARAIDDCGEPCGLVDTALHDIQPTPESLIGYDDSRRLLLLGACAAYSPAVMRSFGQLHPKLAVEDIPLTVRASLLGGVAVLDEILVNYRTNVSVWLPRKMQGENFSRHVARMSHRIRANYWVSRQMLADARLSRSPASIEAAKRRHTAASFALGVCKRRRLSLFGYLAVGHRSGHWRSALVPAFLLAFPRTHRFLFSVNRRIKKSRPT